MLNLWESQLWIKWSIKNHFQLTFGLYYHPWRKLHREKFLRLSCFFISLGVFKQKYKNYLKLMKKFDNSLVCWSFYSTYIIYFKKENMFYSIMALDNFRIKNVFLEANKMVQQVKVLVLMNWVQSLKLM